jgi:adenylate cyclase
MRKRARNPLDLVVPLAASLLVLGIVHLGLGVTEWRFFDALLHIKPAVTEHPDVTLLVVDDTTINNLNLYPLSRDYMAEGLIVLAEMNARYTVFDVEFVDRSPRGVDQTYLDEELPQQFGLSFSEMERNITDLFRALAERRVGLADAEGLADELTSYAASEKEQLLERVRNVARDNDAYLGNAVRLFGQTVLTVNPQDWVDPSLGDDRRTYALEKLALTNARLADRRDPIAETVDMRPAILPVIRGALAAGFPKVIVDPDGVQRRVDILYRYKGEYFAQLGLAGLLDWMGNPEVRVYRNRLVLEGARHPERGERDISIPLTTDGKFLVNWPRKLFQDSFRQLSFYTTVVYRRLERDLASNLQLMDQEGYLGFTPGGAGILPTYRAIVELERDLLSGAADRSLLEDYRQARSDLYEQVGAFLRQGGDAEVTPGAEEQIRAEYTRLLDSGAYTPEQEESIRGLVAYAGELFEATRSVYEALVKVRAELALQLGGRFVIIGYTGTSTTDIGVNPFQEEYMNVGTHASVVNTILSGEFLDDTPWWVSLLVGLVASAAVTFGVGKMQPLASILVGIGSVVLVVVGLSGFFLLTGVYVGVLAPSIQIVLTFIALTVMKFLRTEKERGYIRNAFAHYLSNDVINDLLDDPDKLNLGGEKKYLTAMFTDVKGFSTISEKLDPTDLVRLLNSYLTEMSDTILAQRGTIDKYEGDAIIAFFGAPVEFTDHAERALYAACRMKSLEAELNQRVLEANMSPTPLLTRIGINTGEMVVGNMGTSQKMDYTIMGSSVNLAARLEGVNKQYGTWMLMSEATHKEAGESYVCRKLDRVRVVGINEPVRLFELVGNPKFVSGEKKEAVERFHVALEHFEQRDWVAAEGGLKEILRLDPEDGPSVLYAKRCVEYKTSPPAASWDGVYNLSTK